MKYFMILAAGGLIAAGCSAPQEEFNETTHTWKTNQGTYAWDHVAEKKVEISKAVQRNYLGETYFFESEENARKFDSNPWAYLYDHNSLEDSGTLGTRNIRD